MSRYSNILTLNLYYNNAKRKDKNEKIFDIFIIFTFFTNLKADILPNFFKDYETKGVFVLYDGKSFLTNDKKRAEKCFSPASTFKIFNALFALNLGIVKNEEEIFYHYNNEKIFCQARKMTQI